MTGNGASGDDGEKRAGGGEGRGGGLLEAWVPRAARYPRRSAGMTDLGAGMAEVGARMTVAGRPVTSIMPCSKIRRPKLDLGAKPNAVRSAEGGLAR